MEETVFSSTPLLYLCSFGNVELFSHVSYSFIMCLVPSPKSHLNFPWRAAFLTPVEGPGGGMWVQFLASVPYCYVSPVSGRPTAA